MITPSVLFLCLGFLWTKISMEKVEDSKEMDKVTGASNLSGPTLVAMAKNGTRLAYNLVRVTVSGDDEVICDVENINSVHDACIYSNILYREDIVDVQIEEDKKILTEEWEAEQEDIRRLEKIRGTKYFERKTTPPSALLAYLKTIINYQGTPLDFFIFIIMPVVVGKLFSDLLGLMVPKWLDEFQIITEYPRVPLIYFQQTEKEASNKRPARKTVEGISKHFIIRANETYIELQEIRDAALTRQTLTRSPWALVQFLIRLQLIYESSQERRAGEKEMYKDTEKETEKQEQRRKELIRFAEFTESQDQTNLANKSGNNNNN